ncbi:MAG TPA: hypothetical protein VK465_08035 [Fibrobacteria bacterium]|nr:hypothetical protein [Fibrobacteria bacterium]
MPFKSCLGCFHGSKSTSFRKEAKPPIVYGLKPKEAPLAGYLMARAAMHQKIDGSVLKNLRAGHETVQEVNDLLPLGGGNVREDIRKAGEKRPDLRLLALSNMVKEVGCKPLITHGSRMTNHERYQMLAATSQFTETGSCDFYAANTTTLHASKLAGMKEKDAIVSQCSDPVVGHIWSEMIPRGKGPNGKLNLHDEDAIMDGWCKERVATLREDSAFAHLDNGNGDFLKHSYLLDHESGPRALNQVKMFKARIESSKDIRDGYHNEFNRLVTSNAELNEQSLWDAQSVFHGYFRQQAGAALDKDAGHPSLAEIQAVGVARSLGSNIRGAVAEAPGIIASAKEMFST